MSKEELDNLVGHLKEQERTSRSRFSLYALIMIVLGLSIAVWSVREGLRASEYRKEAEAQRKIVDSLTARIEKANKRLAELQVKMLNSHLINSHLRIGLDNFYSKRYEQAIEEYEQAILLDSANYVLYDLRGYSLIRLKRYDAAAASLEKSVELSPRYGWGYYNLTLAYWAQGQRDEARKSLARLMEVSPDLKRTLVNDSQFQEILRDKEVRNILSLP